MEVFFAVQVPSSNSNPPSTFPLGFAHLLRLCSLTSPFSTKNNLLITHPKTSSCAKHELSAYSSHHHTLFHPLLRLAYVFLLLRKIELSLNSLFLVNQVHAAPTKDVVELAERAFCGARMGTSCLAVVETPDTDSDSSSSSTNDAPDPLEVPSSDSEPSQTPSIEASSPTEVVEPTETPVSHLPSGADEPVHRPDTITHANQDTPELASPVVDIKTNGAVTKYQLTFVLPALFASVFVLLV